MKKETLQEESEANFTIRNQDGNEVLTIKKDGSIFYLKEDVLTKVEADADVGRAFALCVMELAGMDYKKMLDIYLGESLRFFKDKLMKEVMESSTTKSIKKADFLKIANGLKL